MANKTKSPLLNFYKAKLKKKELINKSNNIFGNQSNQKILKTFKREISNDKNKLGQMKYKTSKNSPNSSLVKYNNRGGQIENISKKDIIINKISNNNNNFISVSKSKNKIKNDLFEEFFKKKLKKLNKNTNGQISQRQKSTKNIFNNLRNDSSLNSSRLSKIKKTIYGNSNIYFNNNGKIAQQINNSNIIEDNKQPKRDKNSISKNSGLNSINNSSLMPSTSFRKIIVENNTNKMNNNNNIFYNNFLNKQKGNNINNNFVNNEKGYIGNYNLMRHIENKYDNNYINESNKNSINNKNKEDPFLKKYKNGTKSKLVESASNSKIKKINPVDYLYNSKHKKENSKYAVKYIEENSGGGVTVSKKMRNNEPVSCEINGSYGEFNKQNKTAFISKNSTNKSNINKKRIKINEQKNENNNEQNNNIMNSDENKNKMEENIEQNMDNQKKNSNENSNYPTNINSYFNKSKKSKENLKNYISKDSKSNVFNIKDNNSLLPGNYLIKSSQLSSNHVNNELNQEKNPEINSLFNNDMNNNSLLNISNNNNCSNINNQNININININNSSDNKNNNYINNNFIDINNYNKNIVPKYDLVNDSNSGMINNISSNVSHMHYLNNNSDIINNQINNNDVPENDNIIYQKKLSLIPKEFVSSLNSKSNNSKEEELNKNNNIINYNNFNNYNHYNNNQPNIIKAKLVKNCVQMNNFISPNKNSINLINNQNNNLKNSKETNKEKDIKINSINSSKIKIFNDLQEQLCNSKNKERDTSSANLRENSKNKNMLLENEIYDIIDLNDFSPIYDEKYKNDNIQEKINKQNQLHINKNNISLIDNKNIIKNDINFNSNNNVNSVKNKVNDIKENMEELKNKQQQNHKYSQSQSLGKKAKDLNKKIINNISNIKVKNNILFEKKNVIVGENKSKAETNSAKIDTSNKEKDRDRDKDKISDKAVEKAIDKDQDKDKKNQHLIDLLDSKENSKEIKEKNKQKEKDKKNIFSQKLDIFSLQINNSENNNSKNNKNKKFSNDYNDDMLYIPDFPEIRKKEQDNIILTTMSKDCDYYKDEMEKLSIYIKNYYKENGKYPDSRIEFYLYGRQIGHGAFGKVNLALHIASGRLVAIKTFAKKHLKHKHAKQKIKNEINILSKLRHPFINQILDSFETDKHIFIVMEYVCGDLLGFIRKRGRLSESISKLIFKQIIEGLRYIHKKKIVHRDIKLDNILIDLTNTVKICDFGVSRKLSNGDVMYEHCGTPAYIAPEIFGNKGYEGYLCDVWSAGVTLYYMLSGIQPFRANSIKDLENIVLQGKFEEIEEVSPEANELIEQMLQVDPKKRITIENILKHPWLNNVDLENRKNLNLFTQSEKILLSKFDVDYLVSNKEELIENFSLKNLETNNNDTNFNVAGDTKSLIFAPYNSYIEESNDKAKNTLTEEDIIYKELQINNNICKFGFKVQQANIKYELSNNNDFDNGVIKTQREEDIKNQNEKIEKKYEEKLLNEKLSGLNTPRVRSANDSFEESEKIVVNNNVIKQIEKDVGYDRKYILNCINKNKINYATATYYLMAKDNIK